MAIMTRFLRLCKADVHGVMDQLEDKGLLLKQYLREMESALDRKARRLAALTQQLARLTGRIGLHTEEIDKLEQDLNLALGKEKDDIARMLIRRRGTLERACNQLKASMETMTQEKIQLEETLSQQRLEYEMLRTKADAFCHRYPEVSEGSEFYLFPGSTYPPGPGEAEIEIELLQRKEALRKGDTP